MVTEDIDFPEIDGQAPEQPPAPEEPEETESQILAKKMKEDEENKPKPVPKPEPPALNDRQLQIAMHMYQKDDLDGHNDTTMDARIKIEKYLNAVKDWQQDLAGKAK